MMFDYPDREKDYGPVGVGDRVILNAPNGRKGSNARKIHGQHGTVTKAGPKNLTVETDDGDRFELSHGYAVKNNSGNRSLPS